MDDRENVMYDNIQRIVLGSENSRLAALLELRKDMMKDYKDKYEKAA